MRFWNLFDGSAIDRNLGHTFHRQSHKGEYECADANDRLPVKKGFQRGGPHLDDKTWYGGEGFHNIVASILHSRPLGQFP